MSKETVEQFLRKNRIEVDREFNHSDPHTTVVLSVLLEEYASSQCKKQREICSTLYYAESKRLNGTWWEELKKLIRNAPEPK